MCLALLRLYLASCVLTGWPLQELDYVQMRFLFGAQSFFRSVQVCIGQACLYNYDLISKRVFADGTSVSTTLCPFAL